MFFRVILFARGFVLDLASVSHMIDDEKDMEILLLRQQLTSSNENRSEVCKFHAGRRCP
jgi:hypothetical protein